MNAKIEKALGGLHYGDIVIVTISGNEGSKTAEITRINLDGSCNGSIQVKNCEGDHRLQDVNIFDLVEIKLAGKEMVAV